MSIFKVNRIEPYSGSIVTIGSVQLGVSSSVFSGSFSGSFDGNADNLTIGGVTITTLSGSVTGRLTDLEGFSSSLDATFATDSDLSTISSSLATDISASDSRLDTLEGKTLISSSIEVDHDSTTGFVSDEHINHTTVTLTAGNGLIGGGTIAASRTFAVGQGDGIVTSSDAIAVDSTVVRTSGNQTIAGIKTFTGDNIFNGTQTFANIDVNGTGSFAYIQSVTGSAKIIGDAFVVLNADSPAERYAGLTVYDSGSDPITTASLFFDGVSNDWNYEYKEGVTPDYAVMMFGPEYGTKGSPTYLTDNTIPLASGSHHFYDSNITDNGTTVSIDSNTVITGSLIVTVDVTGSFSGSFQGDGSGLTNTGATIANDANNRITTAVGDGTLNAESGLTYDGSTLSVTGAITSTGDITGNTSDDRLKDKLGNISDALAKLNSLTGFYYKYNDLAKSFDFKDENQRVGLSAQDLLQVLPEAVAPAPFDTDENGQSKTGENYLTVRYERVVPLLVEAIKELQQEIEEIKKQL